MPELPEVETVRRCLEHHLDGLGVVRVEGKPIAMRRALDPSELSRRLEGRELTAARRRGKYLLLDFGEHGSLLVHLGMSGRLTLASPEWPVLPHTHLELHLSDGRQLRFVDPRRFGFAQWLCAGEESSDPSLARLGVKPLRHDLDIILPAMYRRSRAPLKSLLLDQRLVVGIGNIYATEALWRARIRPGRPGNATSVARLEVLAGVVRDVLEEAIAQGGTTLRDFASPEGGDGYFAVRLQVYGKHGSPCPACRRELSNAVIAGRATAWCKRCQR